MRLRKPAGLACLFDPEFTPARRTDFTIDQRAGVRLLEQRAVAAPLIAFWCILIFGDLLSHLGGSLLSWGKRCCGYCCTGEASNDNGSPGQRTPLSSRTPSHFHLPSYRLLTDHSPMREQSNLDMHARPPLLAHAVTPERCTLLAQS